MKTRSQLIHGYLNNTLSDTERRVALQNKIVMSEVERIKKEKATPKTNITGKSKRKRSE